MSLFLTFSLKRFYSFHLRFDAVFLSNSFNALCKGLLHVLVYEMYLPRLVFNFASGRIRLRWTLQTSVQTDMCGLKLPAVDTGTFEILACLASESRCE